MDFGYGFTQQHDAVAYLYGGKNVRSGRIDCSGWIVALNKNIVDKVRQTHGDAVAKQATVATSSAAEIVRDQVGRGNLVTKRGSWGQINPDELKAGMLIGESRGSKAKNRYGAIGHIVAIVEKDGKKYVSESTSAKGTDGQSGVRLTPLESYISQNAKRNFDIHVVNPYKGVSGLQADGQQVAQQPYQPYEPYQPVTPQIPEIQEPQAPDKQQPSMQANQSVDSTPQIDPQTSTRTGLFGDTNIFGTTKPSTSNINNTANSYDILGAGGNPILSAVQSADDILGNKSLFDSSPLSNGISQLFNSVEIDG